MKEDWSKHKAGFEIFKGTNNCFRPRVTIGTFMSVSSKRRSYHHEEVVNKLLLIVTGIQQVLQHFQSYRMKTDKDGKNLVCISLQTLSRDDVPKEGKFRPLETAFD